MPELSVYLNPPSPGLLQQSRILALIGIVLANLE